MIVQKKPDTKGVEQNDEYLQRIEIEGKHANLNMIPPVNFAWWA